MKDFGASDWLVKGSASLYHIYKLPFFSPGGAGNTQLLPSVSESLHSSAITIVNLQKALTFSIYEVFNIYSEIYYFLIVHTQPMVVHYTSQKLKCLG